MIQWFFKTSEQMGERAGLLTKGQEGDLRKLINALCIDDIGCRASMLANDFQNDIEMDGARMLVEVHKLPGIFTELYLSFPTGRGHAGLLKLFRWREAGETRLGLGASNQSEFSITRISSGALRDAAETFFNGMVPRRSKAIS